VTFLKNNGDFLVRKSEENPGDKRSFVLSVQYQGQAKHFLMVSCSSQLFMPIKHFEHTAFPSLARGERTNRCGLQNGRQRLQDQGVRGHALAHEDLHLVGQFFVVFPQLPE